MIVPLGDRALRVALPEGVDRRAALDALRALPGVVDVVLAEATAGVVYDGPAPDVIGALRDLRDAGDATVAEHGVRVRYDGPDLGAVAAWAGLTVAEVIARHAAPLYTVRFVGFLPGFAYLAEVDAAIAAPRLAAPRARVPAGAVALAGRRTGIYPAACPGGWNLLGQAVDFVAFDPARGATLLPGDRVRFAP